MTEGDADGFDGAALDEAAPAGSAPSGTRGRSAVRHAARKPGHRVLVAALSTVLGITAFAVVLAEVSLQRATEGFTTYDTSGLVPSSEPSAVASGLSDPSAGDDLTILVMGSDSRLGEGNQELGAGEVEGMRADTTMVVHISADRLRVEIVAIPRDSIVAISDCRMLDGSTVPGSIQKFNAAFANGGSQGNVAEAAACVWTTLHDLAGLDIDHWAAVDMNGFVDMVEAIDGVPMCITEDMHDEEAHLDLEAGAQVLDGKQALAFARARKSLGDGTDIGRIERQQELLTNMVRKVLGLNVLTDITTGTAFINATARSLSMDEELGDGHYLVGLAWSLRRFDTDDLYMTTVPWHYADHEVYWTQPDAQEVFDALNADEPIRPLLEPEASATPTPAASSSATATPSASADATPTATPSPERETEADILADCEIAQ
ncbi:LCP family protein [Demequina iriomotensis]|uniref:LCP family protein n=1 Tax=Demequina iriomotensis TaxID=1536641 RepID=UPI0007830BC5|nr:LCP family protein [Demequina iriomotensis]